MARVSSDVALKKGVSLPNFASRTRTMSMVNKRPTDLKTHDPDNHQKINITGIEKKGSGWKESTTIS